MSVIFNEPLTYYIQRITSQYQMSPNLIAWVKALYQPLIDYTACLNEFFAEFDLDTAEGAQLDILGDIVGADRIVPFQPTHYPTDQPTLDDTTYRLLIRATVGANFWDGTIDGLQNIWTYLFPSGKILTIDNQDMSFTVVLSGVFTTIIQDLIYHDMIVPRPEGVKVNYTFAGLPLFGVDQETSFVSGVDVGHCV